MENLPGSLSTPVSGKNDVMILTLPDRRDDGLKMSNLTALIRKVHDALGLDLTQPGSQAINATNESDAEVTPCEYDFDTVIECLLNALYDRILNRIEWSAFNIDGQRNGVFAKESVDGASFLDVIALKGFTMNSGLRTLPC